MCVVSIKDRFKRDFIVIHAYGRLPDMKTLLPLLALFCSSMAQAAKILTVPIDVGVGPSALTWTGDLANDQPWHFGLSISAAAIIDQKTLKKHRKKIPKQYRSQLKKMDEIRIGYLLIPDTLILSPKRENTGMFGATWSPISLGIPAEVGNSNAIGGGCLTDLHLYRFRFEEPRDTLSASRTRARCRFRSPPGRDILVQSALALGIYIPQQIGGGVGDLGPILEGQLEWFHLACRTGVPSNCYRFPYSTRI